MRQFGITDVEPEQALDLLDSLEQNYTKFSNLLLKVGETNKKLGGIEIPQVLKVADEYKKFTNDLRYLFM